jgi:hypothetical protein
MAVSPSNILFVLDGSKILLFDQYGNGINVLETNEDLRSINITFNNLLINTDKLILMSNLKSGTYNFSELKTDDELNSPIISSLLFNGRLYILLADEIRIYNLVKG